MNVREWALGAGQTANRVVISDGKASGAIKWAQAGYIGMNWDNITPAPLPAIHYEYEPFLLEFGEWELIEETAVNDRGDEADEVSQIGTERLAELLQADRIIAEIEQMFEDGRNNEEIVAYLDAELA